ncbi:hypothetical protein [Hyunsoonleella ulvae]|uniref:hypothetical protein n=1 Tax=Hyunsoonleella ulvae TaxID=2799948 RepID=UPI00193A4FB3|nr:hypothetical protein [Hyunsoonleella ulvae]
MTILLACLIFVVVAGFAWIFHQLIPKFILKYLEYFLVVIGFIGVLAALSQIAADTRKTRSLELVNDAKETFGYMMQRIEYRMDDCGVWWDVALDQTNKDPELCRVNEKCSNTCRIAHFVSQYRWRPIDTEIADWDNFKMLLCGNSADYENKEADELCEPATKFLEALDKANKAKLIAEQQPFSNKTILIIVQFLIAIALGLEVGKLRLKQLKQ